MRAVRPSVDGQPDRARPCSHLFRQIPARFGLVARSLLAVLGVLLHLCRIILLRTSTVLRNITCCLVPFILLPLTIIVRIILVSASL